MNEMSLTVGADVNRIAQAYLTLFKPRILGMVIVVTALGFLLAGGSILAAPLLFAATILGTAMTGAGSCALNQYIEREEDSLMMRTANRPLPTKFLASENALYVGIFLILLGVTILVSQVNLLTGFLALLTAFLYVLVYTPLKKVTWLNTLVGAIPGALPPVGGWAAVTGSVDPGALLLFLILFVWQIPHFYSIAWMYRDDYKRGGFQMLPVIDPTGRRTFGQIVVHCHLLIIVSLFPAWYGLTGMCYVLGVAAAGAYFLTTGLKLSHTAAYADAKAVLIASLFYLPTLLIMAVLDVSIG